MSFTITTNPTYPTATSGTSQMVTGTIQISGGYGSGMPVQLQVTPTGAIQVNLDKLPEMPESWQLAFFAAASLQGFRIHDHTKSSAEIAAQAYKDAIALVNAMKQVKAVTEALTKEPEPAWLTGQKAMQAP